LRKHIVAIAVLASFGAAHAPASAQAYPARPIRMIVPYTPGGITDVVTRIVSQDYARAFGQNVIVDNRPGANSILGVEMLSKATPDGYTVGSVIAAHAANQTLYPKLPYDSVKSFAPISLVGTAPLILVANSALPANGFKEFLALARSKPGGLSFASSGIGAAAHLSMELLMMTAGLRMVHVPYKGTAPALQDLIGGQVQVMFDVPSSMLPHVRAGRIKALAMASEKRASVAPDIPTVIELGMPGYVAGTWVGLLAPAGTPADRVALLGREAAESTRRAEVRERFAQLGIEPVGSTPAEFVRFLQDEVAKWAKVIRTANVKVEQ